MPIQKTEKIWMNGKLVPWDEATVHVLVPTLHYGWGVFEGIRAYETKRGPAVFRLREHMERFQQSADMLMMPLPYGIEEMIEAVKLTVRATGLPSCYIRPIAYLGYGEMGLNPLSSHVEVAIACWPWGAYLGDDVMTHGVRAKVSSWRRIDGGSMLPLAKITGQYVNSSLAKVEAVKAGYDEAILLNSRDFVAEGSGENLFLVREGEVLTPPLSEGVLGGVTRSSVIKIARDLGWTVHEQVISRSELYTADEAFFTGTAAELAPIRAIDEREIGDPGPITRKIGETFSAAAKGELEAYQDWLAYCDD